MADFDNPLKKEQVKPIRQVQEIETSDEESSWDFKRVHKL